MKRLRNILILLLVLLAPFAQAFRLSLPMSGTPCPKETGLPAENRVVDFFGETAEPIPDPSPQTVLLHYLARPVLAQTVSGRCILAFVDPYGLCADSAGGAVWGWLESEMDATKQYLRESFEGSYFGAGAGFKAKIKIIDNLEIELGAGQLDVTELGADGWFRNTVDLDGGQAKVGPLVLPFNKKPELDYKGFKASLGNGVSSDVGGVVPLQNGASIGVKVQLNWGPFLAPARQMFGL